MRLFSGPICRAGGDELLVGGETSAPLRLEHVVGKRVLFGHRPIGPNLSGIDVAQRIRAGETAGTARTEPDAVESIHFTAVVLGDESGMQVIEVLTGERRLHQFEMLPGVKRSVQRAFGTGIRGEEIVEAAVLLDYHDDVLDLLRRWGRRRNTRRVHGARHRAAAGSGARRKAQRHGQ